MIWFFICLAIKKFQQRVTDLFIRSKKSNIFFVFIPQSYYAVSKKIRLNSPNYFTMKVPNKQEHQQIALNHFEDFMNLYNVCNFAKSVLYNLTFFSVW